MPFVTAPSSSQQDVQVLRLSRTQHPWRAVRAATISFQPYVPTPALACQRKSSLKHVAVFEQDDEPVAPEPTALMRTKSLPTPNAHVHFPDVVSELQSVRLFHRHAKPKAVIADPTSETETESESPRESRHGSPAPLDLVLSLDLAASSPLPGPGNENVRLDSVMILPTRPQVLVGIVLVRNVAFSKRVTARFTPDNWMTTSEVSASYIGPCPPDNQWERWRFPIRLETSSRAIHLAVRFVADGVGEWWDNNGGGDYLFTLTASPLPQRVPIIAPKRIRSPPPGGFKHQPHPLSRSDWTLQHIPNFVH